MLRVGDDDFDENEAYLKYDYSLSCTTPGYLYGWKIFAIVMVAVYPFGVPCVYLFLVYRWRHYLNPEPWFIIADVKRSGEFSGIPADEITEEMKELAKMAFLLRKEANRYRNETKKTRDQKVATQADKRRELAKSRRMLRRVLSKRDHAVLPEDWEDVPTEAATILRLNLSATCLEQELITQHREASPRVLFLGFLVSACAWPWSSCHRFSSFRDDPRDNKSYPGMNVVRGSAGGAWGRS